VGLANAGRRFDRIDRAVQHEVGIIAVLPSSGLPTSDPVPSRGHARHVVARWALPLDELTVREREVLELVASGLGNQEIGDRLGLSEKTIKHYMTNILGKLHVRSRVEAALLAAREGMGTPADAGR
jgi:DNA-binding NarL/FixJ family response regulator